MSKHNRDRRLFRAAGWPAGDRIFGFYGHISRLQDFVSDALSAGAKHILAWSDDSDHKFYAVCDATFCLDCGNNHAELGPDILRRAARGKPSLPLMEVGQGSPS